MKHFVKFSIFLFGNTRLLIFLILFALFAQTSAQKPNTDPTGDEKWGRAYLMAGDFVTALKEYLLLIKKDSLNPEYNYFLATCYLNTNFNKTKALPYMEFASRQPKMDPIVFYDLGRAYQVAYRFQEAIDAFKKYKTLITGNDMNYIPADMQIEMCVRAMDMIQHPVNVKFENLGSYINSPYPDYSPYISKNENTIYYTSKRQGNIGNLIDYDGYYTSDLFSSENKYGIWDKPKRLPTTINTPLVEEMAGLSSDGSYLFAFVDNLDVEYEVRYAIKNGKSFQNLLPMGTKVNPVNQGATAVTISHDKKTIIFAATREGSIGGSDLFLSRILPNGFWGEPESLGNTINTKFDEEYPQLTTNDKRLYFSSIGHGSMGGYDIFYSDWDSLSQKWSKPVNIGYPVNTPDDDLQISFTASGRYAYLAALRPEGYGNLDIYRVIFNDVAPAYSVLKGCFIERDSVSVLDNYRKNLKIAIDSLSAKTDSAVLAITNINDSAIVAINQQIVNLQLLSKNGPKSIIKVFDKSKNTIYGTYLPNPITGLFAIVLPPGDFSVHIECEGYQALNQEIKVSDMEMPLKEINRNFVLSK